MREVDGKNSCQCGSSWQGRWGCDVLGNNKVKHNITLTADVMIRL